MSVDKFGRILHTFKTDEQGNFDFQNKRLINVADSIAPGDCLTKNDLLRFEDRINKLFGLTRQEVDHIIERLTQLEGK